jgi:hypothetical protein
MQLNTWFYRNLQLMVRPAVVNSGKGTLVYFSDLFCTIFLYTRTVLSVIIHDLAFPNRLYAL